MSAPFVSFVIPCYNYGRFLEECLDGIRRLEGNQRIEVIAVDDASSDNTWEILKKNEGPDFRLFKHERNQGHVQTVNDGLQMARGEFVVRVDPDDRHRPFFLRETLPILLQNPKVGLVFGNIALINESGSVTCERCQAPFPDGDYQGNQLIEILKKNYICAPTVVARRTAWMEAWPVPSHLAFNDWYFSVMLARKWEFYYRDKVVADYRVHAQNHHRKVILNRSEEASVCWVLDKVFAEPEGDPQIEAKKTAARKAIYGAHYFDFADKYFGLGMWADARRCYLKVLFLWPASLCKQGGWRRLLATLMPQDAYQRIKRILKGP